MDIIYQDQWLVVIDKPPGLMVHRSAIGRDVTEFALQRVRDLVGQRVYTVHRLDRPTSGLLVFALDKEAARILSGQFARREIEKTYRGLVRGFVEPCGRVEKALEREPGLTPKPANTHWERLSMGVLPYAIGRYPTARYSFLSLHPSTGRRHQIRRHCAHLRHPIVGDVRYGDRHHNHFFRDQLGMGRLFLHAEALEFSHPSLGTPMALRAPVPPQFDQIQARLLASMPDEPVENE